jgi:hypothetical protein
MVGTVDAVTARAPSPRVLAVVAVTTDNRWIELYRRAGETADAARS